MLRIFILLIALNLNSAFAQEINCAEMINQQPNFLKKSTKLSPSLLAEDIKILKQCGNFTDADSLLFKGPILASLMIKYLNQSESLTYGRIIKILHLIKNDNAYKELVLSEQLEKSNPTKIEEKPYKFNLLISYENALFEAKQANKKLLLFFSAYSDVNSARMEDEVFIDKKVKDVLNQNFVCFRTYVDDRTSLPISDHYFSKVMNKEVKTIGEKFLDLQLSKFKSDRVPHFFIIDGNGKLMKQLIGFEYKKKFLAFLR